MLYHLWKYKISLYKDYGRDIKKVFLSKEFLWKKSKWRRGNIKISNNFLGILEKLKDAYLYITILNLSEDNKLFT